VEEEKRKEEWLGSDRCRFRFISLSYADTVRASNSRKQQYIFGYIVICFWCDLNNCLRLPLGLQLLILSHTGLLRLLLVAGAHFPGVTHVDTGVGPSRSTGRSVHFCKFPRLLFNAIMMPT
jgi:hypothetical protein